MFCFAAIPYASKVFALYSTFRGGVARSEAERFTVVVDPSTKAMFVSKTRYSTFRVGVTWSIPARCTVITDPSINVMFVSKILLERNLSIQMRYTVVAGQALMSCLSQKHVVFSV